MIQMIKKKHKNSEQNLTLVGHLTELRKRLIYCLIVLLVAVFVCFDFSDDFVRSVINIVPDTNFIYIAPAELFMSYLKMSIIGGFVISAPFILYQIWSFVSPALDLKEKRYLKASLYIGAAFFIIGIIFSYLIVAPTLVSFFHGFQSDATEAAISFKNYVTFVLSTLLSFGVIFELPILMVLLTKFNIVKINFLKQNRRYFILVIFIVAAFLTPPDIISQTLLAIPMLLLFEIGILLSMLVKNKDNKNE